jgi:ABC-2 type transport system ATP-binding protein
MIRLSGHLNRQFDHPLAVRRCAELCLPGDNKVGKLSGGQQAQLALTLALSRRPRLLILDEPLARLDPLARHEFMALLMVAAAEDGLSILLSSHVVSELERVANHLVVLAAGRVQMAGDIVELLEHHRVLVGPADQLPLIERRFHVLEARRGQRQASLVVAAHPDDEVPAGWQAAEVNLEELVLALLREGRSSDKGRLGVSEEPEKARVTA